MPSFVWKHFKKIDSENARCLISGCTTFNHCNKGTTGLIYHLKTHNIEQNPDESNNSPLSSQMSTSKRQKLMTDFSKKRSIEEDVARMVTQSNF